MNMQRKYIIIATTFVCVVSFVWLSGESPNKYIEIFEDSGFTVVKTSSKLNLLSDNVISTNSMNQFTNYMTWWTSKMREPIIYWYKDSQGGFIFYYIDVQGRSIAFRSK